MCLVPTGQFLIRDWNILLVPHWLITPRDPIGWISVGICSTVLTQPGTPVSFQEGQDGDDNSNLNSDVLATEYKCL